MKLLDEVKEITNGERRRDYGHPLYNFIRIAIMWSGFRDTTFTPSDVAWMMVALKAAREANTTKRDNALDTMGYVQCLQAMWDELIRLEIVETEEEAMQYLDSMTLGDMEEIMRGHRERTAR